MVHNNPITHRNYFREIYYPNHRTACIKSVTKWKKMVKQFVLDYKENHPCSICGESDPACLDFHHKGLKGLEISDMVKKGRGVRAIRKELENCIVVCANCHRKLHRNEESRKARCEVPIGPSEPL